MFAEDVNLLPNDMFTRMLAAALSKPEHFQDMARELFDKMQSGGMVGFERVDWFNGGLFDRSEALKITEDELAWLTIAASRDWKDVEPAIFGTLLEQREGPMGASALEGTSTRPRSRRGGAA